jgi:hypothetical protein
MLICRVICFFGLFSAFSVQALPNYWSFESGQGYDNYSIISKDNKVKVSVSCGEMAGLPSSENRVFITRGKVEEDSSSNDFEFLIDGETFYVPRATNYRNGGNDWRSFFEAISITNSFSVYKNNKLIETFAQLTLKPSKIPQSK